MKSIYIYNKYYRGIYVYNDYDRGFYAFNKYMLICITYIY